MAEHGYAREYDEAPDRGEDRGRWRDEDRERSRRGSGREWAYRQSWPNEQSDPNERNLNFMLGDRHRSWEAGRNRNPDDDYLRSRGERYGSSSRGEYRQYRGSREGDWDQPYSARYNPEERSGGTEWERSPSRFRSQQDDHYLSWRNRQLEALDRDYQDYCREREQQFHREFDDWRQNRQKHQGSKNDELLLDAQRERTHNRALGEEGNSPSPVGDATLGTNNSENSGTGRAKPSA